VLAQQNYSDTTKWDLVTNPTAIVNYTFAVPMNAGNTVLVTEGYAGGGTPGEVYKYLGNPVGLVLAGQNYADTTKWALVTQKPALTATTTTGNVRLTEVSGDLPVSFVEAGPGNDVTLAAQGAITVAQNNNGSFTDGRIGKNNRQGGIVRLDANGGSIGASGRPITLYSGTFTRDYVSAEAAGDIYLSEGTFNAAQKTARPDSGVLRLLKAESLSATGVVSINVSNGQLIDVNGAEIRDERTDTELRNGVWSDLRLTDTTGGSQRVTDTLNAYKAVKQQEYKAYWMYRNMQPTPGTYDPNFQVALSPSEDAYYRNVLGFDNAAIQTLVNKRTQEYHDLHARYGSVGATPNAYDPNFTYTFAGGEEQALRDTIRVFTEEELLFTISASVLKPSAGTQDVAEDSNIIAHDVIITTVGGGVGVTTGEVVIDLTNRPRPAVLTPPSASPSPRRTVRMCISSMPMARSPIRSRTGSSSPGSSSISATTSTSSPAES
jgi:hypothetical protein